MFGNRKYIVIAATLLVAIYANASEVHDTEVDPVPEPMEELNEEQDCPLICPALYAPTCGTDGAAYQQFENSCLMKVANCQLKRALIKPYAQTDMYWCTSKLVENLHEKLNSLDILRPECLKPCPMIYAPVCISNGELRGIAVNECQMEIYNCALRSSNAPAALFKVLRGMEC